MVLHIGRQIWPHYREVVAGYVLLARGQNHADDALALGSAARYPLYLGPYSVVQMSVENAVLGALDRCYIEPDALNLIAVPARKLPDETD